MTKIFLDPGHGGSDPGAVGHGMREKDLVLDIALRLRRILENEYQGVQVLLSRTTDVFITLEQRSKLARDWGADGFVSIHLNAFTATANGCETFMHNASSVSGLRNNLHANILTELRKRGTVIDRGLKSANFAVLRGTYQTMKTALTEALFITNANDAALLKQSGTIDAIARGHAIGFEKEFGLKKKNNASTPSDQGNSNVYIVKQGDTLSSIARDHNKTVQALVQANSGIDPNRLSIGQRINLSGSQTAPQPIPTKPAPNPATSIDEYKAAAQRFLNSRGYPEARKGNFRPLNIDGLEGPLSRQAVIRVAQYFGGTTVDGIPGPRTLGSVVTIRRGGNSEWWNRLLQSALNLFSNAKLKIDGVVGDQTVDAIITFQHSKGLTQDGIVGSKTWEATFK